MRRIHIADDLTLPAAIGMDGKDHKQLPILRAAPLAHQAKHTANTTHERQVLAA